MADDFSVYERSGPIMIGYMEDATEESRRVTDAQPLPVSVGGAPLAAAAWTKFRDASVDNSNQAIKTSAGVLGSIVVTNKNAEDCWLHLYDAANVSGTPAFSLLVPKGDGTARGGSSMDWGDRGLTFSTAIRYNAVTTAAAANPGIALELSGAYV